MRAPGGSLLVHPSEDAIIGTQVTSTGDQGVAKLVDLDTDQQGVSAIFGHRITLNAGSTSITGDMETAEANGLWISVVQTVAFGNPGGNTTASGYFQTAVRKDGHH